MILFFGKHGQLAQSFQATEPAEYAGQAVYLSSLEANFEKPERLHGQLDKFSPEIIVLCAAYTQVDKAEEEKHVAELVNAKAPQEIARWCAQNNCVLIHFSTDYVFAGNGTHAWEETDQTGPLNWYGETKLMGEEAIQATGCRHFIFRTSWVVSEYGKNFVKTMLRLGREKEILRVVQDQFGSPTYAPDLAEAIWKLIRRIKAGEKLPSGIYHLAGQGETNWAQFAEAIFDEARKLRAELSVQKVEGIEASQFPTQAMRPHNSRLDQSKAKNLLGLELPMWRESLKLCLKRIGVS